MPIYDNNGTVNAQIGKIWDNDGTTNRQIGKIYDNDGTTNSPIFSATIPTFLYQNGAPDGESFINMVGSNYSNSDNGAGVGGQGFTEGDFNISEYIKNDVDLPDYVLHVKASASSENRIGYSCCNQGISNYMDLSDIQTIEIGTCKFGVRIKEPYKFLPNWLFKVQYGMTILLEDNNGKTLELLSQNRELTHKDVDNEYGFAGQYGVSSNKVNIQDKGLNLSNCRIIIRSNVYFEHEGTGRLVTSHCYVSSITCTAVQ